jgi:hypothetical protein
VERVERLKENNGEVEKRLKQVRMTEKDYLRK